MLAWPQAQYSCMNMQGELKYLKFPAVEDRKLPQMTEIPSVWGFGKYLGGLSFSNFWGETWALKIYSGVLWGFKGQLEFFHSGLAHPKRKRSDHCILNI